MVRRLVSVSGPWLLAAIFAAPLSAQLSVRRAQVLGDKDAVEIEVESSGQIVPETRVLTGPDRLVIDFPNSTPGSELRSQSVDRGAVKDLRMGLFQSKPPVTRIVLDLKSAQSFQLFPNGRTVIIKIGGGGTADTAASAAGNNSGVRDEPHGGLVPANFTAGDEPVHATPAPRPLEVSYRNGLLSIRANKVPLSQVLTAVQQRTGAQVVLPPGADQERIVVDLGPAPAPDVLSKLLYGSQFNFLIMSAANNPSQLDRLILTPRADAATMPLQPMPVNDVAQDAPPDQPPPQDEAQAQPGMPPPQHAEVPVPAPGANPPPTDPPDE